MSSPPTVSTTSSRPEDEWVFDVLFVGSGQSSSVPLLKHVLGGEGKVCQVCADALRPGSKNKRNNVSVAIIKRLKSTPRGATPRCVLIDCGKTFREAIFKTFIPDGIREVGNLLITHGHADAILGLDDIRDLQNYEQLDPGVRYHTGPCHVFLHDETNKAVRGRFDYLTNPPVYLNEAEGILERPVSYLQFHEIDVHAEIAPDDVPIRVFPVYHGGDYISLGFDIGGQGKFVYISDVKDIPEESMEYLKSLHIDTLVLDCIKWDTNNFAHASFRECRSWIDEWRPRRVLLVGMGCGIGDHDEANAEFKRRGYPQVELAFDGLYLEGFPLEGGDRIEYLKKSIQPQKQCDVKG